MKSILQNNYSRLIFAALFVVSMFTSLNLQASCSASFIAVPDSVGNGVNFYSTSTGTTGTTNYYWTFGDNSSGSGMNAYHQYAATGWYLVCLLITDSACQSTYCDSVYVGTNGIFCQAYYTYQTNGLTVSFLDQSIGANLNYDWNFGDGSTGSGQNATHTYAQAGQYLVCLTISSGTCSDTVCGYVNVTSGGGNCQASFYTVDSAGVTYFINMSTGALGVPSYVWDFGDGSFGYNQYESHIYNSTQGFLACLTVTYTDTSNQTILCTSTFCDSVNGSGGTSTCQASFNWMTGASAGEIDFTDLSSASDSIVSWAWDFGDGSTSGQQNPSHVYAQSGAYYICLTISAADQNGIITCTSTSCSFIQVQVGGGGCQASFVYYDSAGTYYFINTSTGINFFTTAYFWDFGDGTTSSAANPSHNFNTIGPYLVCLTISDSVAGCSSTFCDSVASANGGNCQAAFNAVPDSAGFGYSFYDASTGTNQLTTYTWTISDGTTATGNSFHHNFASQGWYQVCLTVTVYDSLQNVTCASSTCDSVYAGNGGGAWCNANWGYQGNSFVVFFADLSTGTDTIVSWSWDFGDGSTSTQQNPVHNYSQSGYYLVCLTIETGANGAITCTSTYCNMIYAGNNNTFCQANFSMYPDSTGLGFQFQNISSGTTGTTMYTWSFGDGGTSALENPFHMYATTGSYTVCLTISDSAANCSSTYCDSISVGQSLFCNPYFVWNGDTTNGVQFYQFNNNLNGIVYEWDFGDGDSSNTADPYHQYAAAGSYYACLTVLQLDSNGFILCTGTYCDSVYAGGNSPFCSPQIIAVPDSNGWGNGNVNFSVYSPCGNITSVTWDFGDGTSGTGMNPTHQYSTTGWYYVCVDLEINGFIYTQCDSVFALRLVGIEELTGGLSAIAVYPNPASTQMHLSYTLNRAQHVSVVLYDMAGRNVLEVVDQKQVSGLHAMDVNLSGVSPGIYMLKATAENAVMTKRIVVNR